MTPGMKSRIPLLATCLALLLPWFQLSATAGDDGAGSAGPVVVLDPGHTATMPGATGITGRREVEYNDNLVVMLSKALAKAGFAPITTRRPDQEITLEERSNIANAGNALLLLSIHHDSAQLSRLEPVEYGGIKTYRTRNPITGYSIFVSGKNQQFVKSQIFARLLGQELSRLGRKPSLHHAEPIPGEGRPLLDATLGIYRFDDLAVLKKSVIPAVLLEVGVIVDRGDEAYVSRPGNQEAITGAIVSAIARFNAAGGESWRK